MRAVLGFLLLGLGFTVAYLVLSGKVPSSSPLVNSPSPNNPAGETHSENSGGQLQKLGLGSGPGPLGLPTMLAMQDVGASLGGMRS